MQLILVGVGSGGDRFKHPNNSIVIRHRRDESFNLALELANPSRQADDPLVLLAHFFRVMLTSHPPPESPAEAECHRSQSQ